MSRALLEGVAPAPEAAEHALLASRAAQVGRGDDPGDVQGVQALETRGGAHGQQVGEPRAPPQAGHGRARPFPVPAAGLLEAAVENGVFRGAQEDGPALDGRQRRRELVRAASPQAGDDRVHPGGPLAHAARVPGLQVADGDAVRVEPGVQVGKAPGVAVGGQDGRARALLHQAEDDAPAQLARRPEDSHPHAVSSSSVSSRHPCFFPARPRAPRGLSPDEQHDRQAQQQAQPGVEQHPPGQRLHWMRTPRS